MEHRTTIKIINKLGLHARAAAKLVTLSSHYQSKIQLRKLSHPQEHIADCKSIMSIMMLAAGQGTELELLSCGEDAQEAQNAVIALIENRFGEAE